MMKRLHLLLVRAAVFVLLAGGLAVAQSIISGDIAGSIKDPTGAVLPNAAVTLKNVNTGVTLNTTSNGDGQYRFALVPPGTYTIDVAAPGFQTAERTGVVVVAGQPVSADIQLAVASASMTVEVTEQATVLQAENADTATVFNSQQVLNMPNPGSDMTFIAQTAPGVTMNTQSGYGNFSSQGMPGTSNLFMVNGQNFNDPFLNLNNSGASNLLLGSNDIAEASVVTNAYSAQYGQFAGAQMSLSTKYGTNAFHGNGIYMWNGRALNANDFFSNQAGTPRPFLNFNQWQTSAQGPIWKNHTFFDVDYEGARVVLPTASTLVKIPSPQFQAATLANLQNTANAGQIPFYQQVFSIENGAPGAKSATPLAGGGCGSFTVLGPGVPCVLTFRTTPPNSEREYLWSARVDHNFSEKDRGYIRVYRDNGFQPTYTDYFTPVFNDVSKQPQMSGQVTENHVFGPNSVNQFNGSAFYYSATFASPNLGSALQLLPVVFDPQGAFFQRVGGENFDFPQGRRVFQYQIIDDFTKTAGKHTVRLGFSWLHDTVTDLGFGLGTVARLRPYNLAEFYAGGGPNSYITQNFPTSSEQPFAFNTTAGYISDDWKVSDRLTVSLNLRLENYSNPTCATNCFSHLNETFVGQPASATIPYNRTILANQRNAFRDTPMIVWEPRLGIAWRPGNSDKTVIRAGAGIFADEIAGVIADDIALNTPGVNAFTRIHGSEFPGGTAKLAPNVPGSFSAGVQQANAALRSQFASGGTLQSLQAAVPGFTPPGFINSPDVFKAPTYYKWNFEVQQALGWKTLLSLNYSGMHGAFIPVDDNGFNAYCTGCAFRGIPASAPDPRFGQIDQWLSAGVASYNGLIASVQRRLSSALTWNLNYTWSHSLDDVSNEGRSPYAYGPPLTTNESLRFPQDPHNIKGNYGSSDYDIRHYISMGFVVSDLFRNAGFKHGPARIFGGWTLAGNVFYRTGIPFTVIDTGATGLLNNYGASVFATPVTPVIPGCGQANVQGQTPCLTTSQFAPSGASFGNQGRNSYLGPRFFDVDVALTKDLAITERVNFSFGAQAFNLLNHPNFDQPQADLANPTFGSITGLNATPTSILGAFVGGNNSPRFIEIKGMFRF
ncbi:MAG: TonB-dependent receptor [Acidobacteriaceae bacterium]|nr:TonB-dependent receptor [Acidobacteriaceae bacterium]